MSLLNFFAKKEPKDKNTSIKKEKRKLEEEKKEDEEEEDDIRQCRLPSKKRHVILESDEENEQEKENVKNKNKKDEEMETDETSLNDCQQSPPPTSSTNGQHIAVAKSPIGTPPKRATARKHTGKRRGTGPSTSIKRKETNTNSNQCTSKDTIESTESSIGTTESITNSAEIPESTKTTDVGESQLQKESFVDSKSSTESSINKELDLLKNNEDKTQKIGNGDSQTKKKEKTITSVSVAVKPTSNSSYDPSKTNYHPINDACWKKGQKVPYIAVAKTFEQIEQTSGRLKIISILTNLLRSVLVLSSHETTHCIYLCLNKLGPAYKGVELGIGENILIKALSSATGRNPQQIKAEVAEKGDLGLVAEGSRTTQRTMFTPPPLTVNGVFNKLTEIAKLTGHSSQNKKVDIIKGLFVGCKECEAKYLIRSLGGKLRIGLAEQSVLVALAHSVVYTPPGQECPPQVIDASQGTSTEKFRKELDAAVTIVKNAYCELPNYEVLIPALLEHGIDQLPSHCSLTPGIPLKPMLAHPTKGIQEVLQRFDKVEFSCEWKYDGERAQVHLLKDGSVQIYSRNQEDNTSKYPDITVRIPQVINEGVESCVIDAEAVAWDVEKKQILPFQILSTRKRKDADLNEIKVQVCVFPFDILYLNGRPLVRETFRERRKLLKESFTEIEGQFMFVQSIDSTNVEDIQTFMDESTKGNCEGLMVKSLDKDASYEIAKRSHNWLKLKKDYLEGVGDTLDLVVIGGFHGSGKRTGKYGGFLLACYEEENEEYQVICKIGTGFKDEELEQHATFFKSHVIDEPKPYYNISDGIVPDHWFEPVQVWEVKAADLSLSPVYPAAGGIVDPEKGISLRFPRFLRIREDKKPEQATTSQQVAQLYQAQQNVVKPSSTGADDNETYY